MDENAFKKRMYRSSMVIDYVPFKSIKRVSCLLTAIDFYEGIFTLAPIPEDMNDAYFPESIRAHFSHCEFPIKPLKIVE